MIACRILGNAKINHHIIGAPKGCSMRFDQMPAAQHTDVNLISFGKDALIATAFYGSRMFFNQPLFSDKRAKLWDQFVRPYVIWRPNVFWARTSFGGRFRCSLRDTIQQKLLYFGVWEPNLTNFVKLRLKPGDCFIDVGANIGYFSILASKLVGSSGKVVAFEASPRIFDVLTEHIRVNDSKNVRAVNMAVGGAKGTLRLFAGPDGNGGATSTLACRGEEFECEIATDRLEELLESDEMRRARLIKIDIEGAEAPVLNSIIDKIDAYGSECEIVAEISPSEFEYYGDTAAKVIQRFKTLGFHSYCLHNDYAPSAYFNPGTPLRPTRIHDVPETQTDIVFSRIDADTL